MGDKAKKAGKTDKKADKKKAGGPKTDGPKTAGQATPEPNAAGIVEELRDAGAKLFAAANSPEGRKAIAVGLSIAATAAQAAMTSKRGKATAKPAEGAKATPDGEKPAAGAAGPDAVVAALGGMAETVLAKVFAARKG